MSSLALLDRISDDAVTAQLNDPVSFAANDPQMLTRVSGISVLDSARIDERRQRLETYNEDKVAQYKGGKEALFGFFVGQTMKAMQGKANPQVVNELVKKALSA